MIEKIPTLKRCQDQLSGRNTNYAEAPTLQAQHQLCRRQHYSSAGTTLALLQAQHHLCRHNTTSTDATPLPQVQHTSAGPLTSSCSLFSCHPPTLTYVRYGLPSLVLPITSSDDDMATVTCQSSASRYPVTSWSLAGH